MTEGEHVIPACRVGGREFAHARCNNSHAGIQLSGIPKHALEFSYRTLETGSVDQTQRDSEFRAILPKCFDSFLAKRFYCLVFQLRSYYVLRVSLCSYPD